MLVKHSWVFTHLLGRRARTFVIRVLRCDVFVQAPSSPKPSLGSSCCTLLTVESRPFLHRRVEIHIFSWPWGHEHGNVTHPKLLVTWGPDSVQSAAALVKVKSIDVLSGRKPLRTRMTAFHVKQFSAVAALNTMRPASSAWRRPSPVANHFAGTLRA
jgi:hypothetical protein